MSEEKKRKNLLKIVFAENGWCWLSFVSVALIMLSLYVLYELYPFGDRIILWMDCEQQYAPLFTELYDRLVNHQSLIYSWNDGLGGPFLGNFFNYLSSPTLIFVLIFGRSHIPEAIAAMVLTKAAFSAGSFTLYLKKSLRVHSIVTAGFGVLYAMCGWFVAYYWNVMWLDALIFLPMVAYGIEKIINSRKPMTYVVFLAITLVTNYYMGYMICIFSVLWFLAYYFSKNKLTASLSGDVSSGVFAGLKNSRFINDGVIFAIGSFAAAGLAAFALVPTFICLRSSSATSGTFPEEFKTYFSFFDFLTYHLAGIEPQFRTTNDDGSVGMPNAYSGILTLVLIPVYFLSKKIKIREKITSILLIALFWASFNINYLNYIWHGFHFPNDLPFRFAYIYSFILLALACRAFCSIKEEKPAVILLSAVPVIVVAVLTKLYSTRSFEDSDIIFSVAFAVIYCIFIVLLRYEKLRNIVSLLLFATVVSEVAFCGGSSFNFYEHKSDYLGDYDEFTAAKESIRNTDDELIYRMEYNNNIYEMGGSAYGYDSLSVFSSMAKQNMAYLQGRLGVQSNDINQYTYGSQTPVCNIINGLKYLSTTLENVDFSDDYYEAIELENSDFALNKYYCGIAFAVNDDITGWNYDNEDAFAVQSDWFSLSTGAEGVFEYNRIVGFSYEGFESARCDKETGIITYDLGDNNPESASVTVVFSAVPGTHCYCFADMNPDASLISHISDTGVAAEEKITYSFGLSRDSETKGETGVYSIYVNNDVLNEGYSELSKGRMTVDEIDETYLRGTLTAGENQVVFTSIPYDEGWTVSVDGEEISDDDYLQIGNAYLGFNITPGEHTVELQYHQQGLVAGICISCGTLAILVAAAFVIKKRKS